MASMHGGMDTATGEGGIYTPPQIKSLEKHLQWHYSNNFQMLLDKKNEKNVNSMLLFKLVTILKEVNMTIQ